MGCCHAVSRPANDPHDGVLLYGHAFALKIVGATLLKSFDEEGGKMDPFVKADWLAADGQKWEFCVTRPHKSGHMHPVWNKSSVSVQIDEACTNASLSIEVLEEDEGEDPDHCGAVDIPIVELLRLHRERQDPSSDVMVSSVVSFNLLHRGETLVGHIHLQVMVSPPNRQEQTEVDQGYFQSPVKRLGVSGGTAPFFGLIQAHDESKFWIGKDLSHALDEVGFYEQMLNMQGEDLEMFAPLVKFTFDYKGVVRLKDRDSPDEAPPRQMLVLRNLFYRMKKLRLLDIKIGEVTASAGWQGKSRFSAIKQSLIDGLTNSAAEGFRLEGFDGEPESLLSQDPLLDLGGSGRSSKKTAKKARRLMLQRMKAQEMLDYFSDNRLVEGWPSDPRGEAGAQIMQKHLSPAEAMEVIMAELVDQLVRLAFACRHLAVPQKWIGSSVALGYDAGRMFERGISDSAIQEYIHCNIFDWGRSELLVAEKWAKLSAHEQEDRRRHWNYYCSGIDRLSFEMSLAYCKRYDDTGNVSTGFIVTIMDFDSMSNNDFLGRVELPLEETDTPSPHSVTLLRWSGSEIHNAKLTYWVSKLQCPADSKFDSVWLIHIAGATNLPASPSNPDSFAKVSLRTKLALQADPYTQQTRVLANQSNPMWEETFEFPVMKRNTCSSNKFLRSLSAEGKPVHMDEVREICTQESREKYVQWKRLLAAAAPKGNGTGSRGPLHTV